LSCAGRRKPNERFSLRDSGLKGDRGSGRKQRGASDFESNLGIIVVHETIVRHVRQIDDMIDGRGQKKGMASQMSLGTNLLTIAPLATFSPETQQGLDPKPLAVDINNNVLVIFPSRKGKRLSGRLIATGADRFLGKSEYIHRMADTPECCWPFFLCGSSSLPLQFDDFVPRFPSRAITTFIHGVVIIIEDGWLAFWSKQPLSEIGQKHNQQRRGRKKRPRRFRMPPLSPDNQRKALRNCSDSDGQQSTKWRRSFLLDDCFFVGW
jgi:hypothetical protein